jgi:hypothetical protein
MPNTLHSCLKLSRLVRRLTEMEMSGTPVSPDHFSERFGQFVDFSGSVALSKMLGELPQVSFEPTGSAPAALTDAFLKERATLVRAIVKRFVPRNGPARNRLPTAAEFHANCMVKDVFAIAHGAATPNCDAAFAPYRKLYLALQGTLALTSHRLRVQMADEIAGLSPVLARLASLDKGLHDALAQRQRQFFDMIPALLEQHFYHLLHTHWQTLSPSPTSDDLAPWMAPGGWIATFCGQMQELLLAELEIRLQPVLGLVESIFETAIDEQRSDEE